LENSKRSYWVYSTVDKKLPAVPENQAIQLIIFLPEILKNLIVHKKSGMDRMKRFPTPERAVHAA
jgi:hypothetical protein